MIFPSTYSNERSMEVYKTSLKFIEVNGLEGRLFDLGLAYQSIGDLIPETTQSLWSGHFFPYSESWDELQVSFVLCLFGLYKQSMVSLRSGLEVGLLSVYWNLHDDGHIVIQQWLKSQEDTPRLSDIWKKLKKNRNFQTFQKLYDIRSRLLKLGFLHDYVHTKGLKFSNKIGLLKPNTQTFESLTFRNQNHAIPFTRTATPQISHLTLFLRLIRPKL